MPCILHPVVGQHLERVGLEGAEASCPEQLLRARDTRLGDDDAALDAAAGTIFTGAPLSIRVKKFVYGIKDASTWPAPKTAAMSARSEY